MSDIWINSLKNKSEILTEPNCNRDTLLKDLAKLKYSTNNSKHAMSWDTFGDMRKPEDPIDMMYYLPPTFKGIFASIENEKMSVRHSYEWMILMVPSESNRRIFEATVLLMAATAATEEAVSKFFHNQKNIDELDVFGYSYKELFDIIGTILVPELTIRAKELLFQCFKAQNRHKNPDPEKQLQNYILMRGSYDRYLRYRNLDGFFEGTLLCCLASCGEAGSDLTVGIMSDAIECCIIYHDTHGLGRHFFEGDITNLHRYTGGKLSDSIVRAFTRGSTVLCSIREDRNISASLKQVICNYILSYHTFSYSVSRYGWGKVYSFATEHLVEQINPEEYIKDMHFVKIDRGHTFEQLHSKALEYNL